MRITSLVGLLLITAGCREDFAAQLQAEPGVVHVEPKCGAPSGPCRAVNVDPQTFTCVETPQPDGAACDSTCVLGGSCQAGACVGPARSCDDGNACTIDVCSPATGCSSTPAPGGLCNSQIVGGLRHTCELFNGAVRCWGSNEQGQLGTGTGTNSFTPVAVPALQQGVSAISSNSDYTCALRNSAVLCWGTLMNSVIPGTTVPTLLPGLATGVTAIAVGGSHACAIVNGGVWCWGENLNSQLGNELPEQLPFSAAPVPVTNLSTGVTALGAGYRATCASTTASVFCWGEHQKPNGSTIGDATELPLAPQAFAGPAEQFVIGNNYVCVLKSGLVTCWGEMSPVRTAGVIPGLVGVTQLAGAEHVCAIALGEVRCFNVCAGGACSINSSDGLTPTRIVGVSPGGATALGAGFQHTCARISGAAWCWGMNEYGQLGNGWIISSPIATPVR